MNSPGTMRSVRALIGHRQDQGLLERAYERFPSPALSCRLESFLSVDDRYIDEAGLPNTADPDIVRVAFPGEQESDFRHLNKALWVVRETEFNGDRPDRMDWTERLCEELTYAREVLLNSLSSERFKKTHLIIVAEEVDEFSNRPPRVDRGAFVAAFARSSARLLAGEIVATEHRMGRVTHIQLGPNYSPYLNQAAEATDTAGLAREERILRVIDKQFTLEAPAVSVPYLTVSVL